MKYNKYRHNYLTPEEKTERKKLFIDELKRISTILNKPYPTEKDFVIYSQLPFSPFGYKTIFNTYSNFMEKAGFQPAKSENHFIERKLELKAIFKSIAEKYDNKLSSRILLLEMNKSWGNIFGGLIAPYFGGMFNLCKEIKCDYDSNYKGSNTAFAKFVINNNIEISKNSFSERMKEIASHHNNSLSKAIIQTDTNNFTTTDAYASKWFGGYKKMCFELGIIWIDSKVKDTKEIDILKNIRDIYLKNNRQINQSIYRQKGKYKMELINDYFGSFGKACMEINIETDAMKEIKK